MSESSGIPTHWRTVTQTRDWLPMDNGDGTETTAILIDPKGWAEWQDYLFGNAQMPTRPAFAKLVQSTNTATPDAGEGGE